MPRIWKGLAVIAALAVVGIGVRAMVTGQEAPATGFAALPEWPTPPDLDVPAAAEGVHADVYLSPTCGCCKDWVDHLEAHGFETTLHYMEDLYPVKIEHGVPPAMGSCHTAVIDGYVVEGHTPAADILRLLAERPRVKGIAVPGMPIGSPGMEIAGARADAYNVYTFDERGNATVYARR